VEKVVMVAFGLFLTGMGAIFILHVPEDRKWNRLHRAPNDTGLQCGAILFGLFLSILGICVMIGGEF
jgi:multisubunit Na+/H+ antiporter MnhG subunit